MPSASTQASFLDYLNEKLPQVEAAIEAALPRAEDFVTKPGATARPNAVPDAATTPTQSQYEDLERYLYTPLAQFSSAGGKRVRPVLALLGAEAMGGNPERAMSAAVAIENFQSAALIHDDIADDGQLRRGEPCLHIAHGIGIATNVGDLAITTVAAQLLHDNSLDADIRLHILTELDAMMRYTLEGQALDLGWVRDERWDLTPKDYLFMAGRKTAYYSAGSPLAIGAIAGGGTPEQVEGLRAFGYEAGLAFQIADDLLNLVGEPQLVGKDFRTDISEGKRTLVALEALSRLEGSEHAELKMLLSSHTTAEQDLGRAVELMDASSAIAVAQAQAAKLVQDAKHKLAEISPALDSRSQELLNSMADWFIARAG